MFATKLGFNCAWDWVLGSFDGLILVQANRVVCSGLFLLNPTTLESKKFPNMKNFHSWNLFEFGYDLSSDDYAVVSLCYQYSLKGEFCVYVYMLKKNQWKKIGLSPYDHRVRNPATGIPFAGIFVRGSLHWLAKNYDDQDSWHISAFNIANEEFSEVSPPIGVKNLSVRHLRLGVLKGCLYLMAVVKKRTELWVMKEYGVVESWIKLPFDLTRDSQIVSLDLPEDSLVVREAGKFFLRSSDAREEVIEVLGLPDKSIYRVGMTFVDTLVSPNK